MQVKNKKEDLCQIQKDELLIAFVNKGKLTVCDFV